MSEPREWWIHSTGNAYTRDVSSSFPVVHVIEKSAYDALKAEHDRYRTQSEDYSLKLLETQQENARLKSELSAKDRAYKDTLLIAGNDAVALKAERDAYAQAMAIALRHGIYANKAAVKAEIESVLKLDEGGKP